MSRFLLLALLIVLAQDKKPDKKDAPRILFAVPMAVEPGFSGKVIVRGFKLETIPELKADPAVKLKLLSKSKKAAGPMNFPVERIGDSEFELELTIPKNYSASAVELTAGEVKFSLPVDRTPVMLEKEPNDGFDTAQEIAIPIAVLGSFKNDKDPDVYRFAGKKGTTLRIEVEAAKRGLPVDAILTLYDSKKRILDSCDDFEGSADPVIHFTLPADGTYYLGLIEAHDFGGPHFQYRLRVTVK